MKPPRFIIHEEDGKFYLDDEYTCMLVYADHFEMEGHETDDYGVLLFDTYEEALNWAIKNQDFKN